MVLLQQQHSNEKGENYQVQSGCAQREKSIGMV